MRDWAKILPVIGIEKKVNTQFTTDMIKESVVLMLPCSLNTLGAYVMITLIPVNCCSIGRIMPIQKASL